MNLHIRSYTEEVSEEILRITSEDSRKEFNNFSRSPDRIFVAVLDEKITGWYYLSIPADPLSSCFIYVYVAESMRRKGIGRMIYRHAEKKMLASGLGWWTSYPPAEVTDRFCLAMGFDYTNTNSYMEYFGDYAEPRDPSIRMYSDDDYPDAPDIWSNEYARMHIDLGLPYKAPDRTPEWRDAERAEYAANCERTFVITEGNQIVGIGALFDDDAGIGALAIDHFYSNKGYGARLAIFLTHECMRRGCNRPHLYCETNNAAAFHLYTKIGYREISRESVAVKR